MCSRNEESVWSFKLGRILVDLTIQRDHGYQYDGDGDGEVQAKLDNGEYVAFDSAVTVYVDGHELGANYLGGSVYGADEVADFWTSHRDADPMNRNCSAMRDARGSNVCICHYFPDMVRQAISEAREELAKLQSFNLRRVA